MGYRYLKKILVQRVGQLVFRFLSWGWALCLSTCPGHGGVKKIVAHRPEDNFWNSP